MKARPSNLQSIEALHDSGSGAGGSGAPCDHDGRASGRLVLERGGVRCELVCDCGQVVAILDHHEYRLKGWTAGDHGHSRERWRRSRALLFSVARQRRWRSHLLHARRERPHPDGDRVAHRPARP